MCSSKHLLCDHERLASVHMNSVAAKCTVCVGVVAGSKAGMVQRGQKDSKKPEGGRHTKSSWNYVHVCFHFQTTVYTSGFKAELAIRNLLGSRHWQINKWKLFQYIDTEVLWYLQWNKSMCRLFADYWFVMYYKCHYAVFPFYGRAWIWLIPDS